VSEHGLNTSEQIERVLARAAELHVSHAHLGWFDANGVLRTKRYAARHLRKALTEGVPFLAVPSGIGPDNEIVPTNSYLNPERGYGNGQVQVDAAAVREVPFADPAGQLLLIGQFRPPDDADCVRSRLAAELERLQALGLEAFGGFEMEGAMLLENEQSLRTRQADNVQVMQAYNNTFSFVEQVDDGDFLDELLNACERMDIAVDTLHPEYLGMLEVALAPTAGMRIADNAALYRAVAKLAGRRHDRLVSFMARRHGEQQGCGAHLNLSLRSVAGQEGVFYDPAGPHCLSIVAHQFIAGLIRYLPELFLLLAPNLNSYKRFRPNLFTPLSNTWGLDNKTVAFRALNTGPATARVEVRFAGADLCPHLGVAAVLAAGRRGIEQGLQPPNPITGSGWDIQDAPGEGFPLDFHSAINRLDESEFAREAFGEGFVDNYVGDRRWQLEQFAQVVTDWEIRMFGNL